MLLRTVLAYFVAAMAPNMDVANAVVPAYVVVLLFFAGLLIRKQACPRRPLHSSIGYRPSNNLLQV